MTRLPRASGLLVHPTSLPGPYGIGDLDSAARFVDFLAAADQRLWQVLPLTPTGFGNSPYAAPSAFAGNPLLVGLDTLRRRGLLAEADVEELTRLPAERVDFDRLAPAKLRALRTAFAAFRQQGESEETMRFARFRDAESWWLDDYTLFAALHEREQRAWLEWPESLRAREPAAVAAAAAELEDDVAFHAFAQFLFFEQWAALRARTRAAGVDLVGDIPIFVALDSADVWANQRLFKLDPDGRPRVVAGVPPDYFSDTGQLWGNPLYDWDAMAGDGYAWWARRFEQLLRLVDVVRVDHFRGFQAAWEVPAGESTAVNGSWVLGPGAAFFRAVDRALGRAVPIVAEDLGLITDEVRALLAEVGVPGMKVLQFAFGGDAHHPYLPHTFESPNWVIYTGTHDNDTTRGWYESAGEAERDAIRRYVNSTGDDVAWDCIRLAEASVADVAIIPLQDVLDHGSWARMNTPGAAEGNWTWRALAEELRPDLARRLQNLTRTYGRAGSAP